jgi:hypothetical protein
MIVDNAAAFDRAVREALLPYSRAGMIESEIGASLVWGTPLPDA